MTDRQQISMEVFFHGYDRSREIFDAVSDAVEGIGPAELRITKSQIAFYRKKAFAWAWLPGKYLHGRTAPLVLTLSFFYRDVSPRWKEIVEPYPGRFTHHLELWAVAEIDDQVRCWLQTAWQEAG